MISALEIANLVNGKIIGDSSLKLKGICSIEKGKRDYLTYLKNSSYEKYVKNSKASLFIVDSKYTTFLADKTFIVVDQPGLSFINSSATA